MAKGKIKVMSGGKTKVNKSFEVFSRLHLQAKFRSSLEGIRVRFGIPKEGFVYFEDIEAWKAQKADPIGYEVAKDKLLAEYKIPLTRHTREMVEWYVIAAKAVRAVPLDGPMSVVMFTPSREDVVHSSRPYVDIRIYDTASLKDVQEYLQNEWPRAKRWMTLLSIGKEDSFPARIRSSHNKKRDERIFELASHPRSELLAISHSTQGRKEYLISRAMKLEKYIIAPEAVKKVLQRKGGHQSTVRKRDSVR